MSLLFKEYASFPVLDIQGFVLCHSAVSFSHLHVHAGKKSPVSGKWKEFFFVLKYEEQKLLYYDHENVSQNKCIRVYQCSVLGSH